MRTKLASLMLVLIFALGLSPVSAQDGRQHQVLFDGFGFSFDAALAANVNIWHYAGDPPDRPYLPEPPYTMFVLYNERPAPENVFDGSGGVYVYKTADLAGYTAYQEEVARFQTLLAERPDLTPYMVTPENVSDNTLPFLPIFPAGQVIRARVQYVDTPSVSGISFITAYREDAYPFLADGFLYTFQGLSADGAYYVSAIFPLNTPLFPTDVPANFDIDAFIANIHAYFADSVATLNGATPEDFVPSLTTLDVVIQSFVFEG
jgi:hypothetical protein